MSTPRIPVDLFHHIVTHLDPSDRITFCLVSKAACYEAQRVIYRQIVLGHGRNSSRFSKLTSTLIEHPHISEQLHQLDIFCPFNTHPEWERQVRGVLHAAPNLVKLSITGFGVSVWTRYPKSFFETSTPNGHPFHLRDFRWGLDVIDQTLIDFIVSQPSITTLSLPRVAGNERSMALVRIPTPSALPHLHTLESSPYVVEWLANSLSVNIRVVHIVVRPLGPVIPNMGETTRSAQSIAVASLSNLNLADFPRVRALNIARFDSEKNESSIAAVFEPLQHLQLAVFTHGPLSSMSVGELPPQAVLQRIHRTISATCPLVKLIVHMAADHSSVWTPNCQGEWVGSEDPALPTEPQSVMHEDAKFWFDYLLFHLREPTN